MLVHVNATLTHVSSAFVDTESRKHEHIEHCRASPQGAFNRCLLLEWRLHLQAVASCISPGDHGSTFAGEKRDSKGESQIWEIWEIERFRKLPGVRGRVLQLSQSISFTFTCALLKTT